MVGGAAAFFFSVRGAVAVGVAVREDAVGRLLGIDGPRGWEFCAISLEHEAPELQAALVLYPKIIILT